MPDAAAQSQKRSSTLSGVLPVFQTPFNEDESIDFGALQSEIDWLFDRGADGICLAMVSELLRLSCDDRRQLAAAAVKCARGRGSVVISVGTESTKLAEDLARHAEDAGATALMAIPPFTVSAS
jgi:dihydrodipicolinate synthase/N-acetylneuraminate lyase